MAHQQRDRHLGEEDQSHFDQYASPSQFFNDEWLQYSLQQQEDDIGNEGMGPAESRGPAPQIWSSITGGNQAENYLPLNCHDSDAQDGDTIQTISSFSNDANDQASDGFPTLRNAMYTGDEGDILQLDDQHLMAQLDAYVRLAEPGRDGVQGTQPGSGPSTSQGPSNDESPHKYLEQRVDARFNHQQQYMLARSMAAAFASAQYGHRLNIYLSQIIGNQAAPVQDRMILQDNHQQQADETVDTQGAPYMTPLRSAVPDSAMAQQLDQAPDPTSKRRYTPEEEQIITTMMHDGATAKEVGQRLNRSTSSILLKWGRMRGRFGDPHAAEKRRRGGRGD